MRPDVDTARAARLACRGTSAPTAGMAPGATAGCAICGAIGAAPDSGMAGRVSATRSTRFMTPPSDSMMYFGCTSLMLTPGASSRPTLSALGGWPSATRMATLSRPAATIPVNW